LWTPEDGPNRAQPSARAATVGGNPPLRIYHDVTEQYDLDDASVAIASSGTIFVAFSQGGAAVSPPTFHTSDLVVLRSDDDRDTWEEWGILGDGVSSDYVNPQMKVAAGPTRSGSSWPTRRPWSTRSRSPTPSRRTPDRTRPTPALLPVTCWRR